MTKFTRVLTFALLAPTLFASTLAAQTEPEPPKFTIVISTEKPEVLLGSSVVIAITITNVSQREIGIGCGHHGNMPDGYQYDLRDEQGIVVPKVVYQDPLRPIRPPGNPMPGGCGIKPGKRMEERATISDEYQFGHPGKYTIRVWKPAKMGTPEKPELDRIHSNTITVTVLPADNPPPQ